MTTNYAGDVTNFPANVRIIVDGDKRNATNLAKAAEDLADRTANLKASLTTLTSEVGTSESALASRCTALETLTTTHTNKISNLSGAGGIRIPVDGRGLSVAGFSEGYDGNGNKYWRQTANMAPIVRFAVSDLLRYGTTITAFGAAIMGNAVYGALPTTMPTVKLQAIQCGDLSSAFTDVDTLTDPCAALADFRVRHDVIKLIETPQAISTLNKYYIAVTGDSGYVSGEETVFGTYVLDLWLQLQVTS